MEMFEIMKTRLPEGLEVVKVYQRTGQDQMKIVFSYKGQEYIGWLRKTCAPGFAHKNCDFTICTVMVGLALKRGDLEAAKHWADKQSGIYRVF